MYEIKYILYNPKFYQGNMLCFIVSSSKGDLVFNYNSFIEFLKENSVTNIFFREMKTTYWGEQIYQIRACGIYRSLFDPRIYKPINLQEFASYKKKFDVLIYGNKRRQRKNGFNVQNNSLV